MARRKSKSMKKLEPAVETLTFDLGNTAIATADPGSLQGHSTFYVDISQSASLYNRKFLRQGLLWAVGGMRVNSNVVAPGTTTVQPGNPRGGVIISKAPQNWILSNAWEKAMRTWLRMNKEALAETPSVRPRFMDFKIYLDEKHHNLGFGANKLPVVTDHAQFVGGMTPATAGEWEASKIVFPDSSNPGTVKSMELIATGGNYPAPGASGERAVSLIQGYANSRGLPDVLDPNTPNDADDASGPFPQNWMQAIFNEGTTQSEEVLDDLTGENNLAPYPFENDGVHVDTMYPGGADQLAGTQIHALEPITGSTVGGVTYIKGGAFPCGLIRIDIYNSDQILELNTQLQIDLVPGHHRGYLAESMTEM